MLPSKPFEQQGEPDHRYERDGGQQEDDGRDSESQASRAIGAPRARSGGGGEQHGDDALHAPARVVGGEVGDDVDFGCPD